ncbi:unnamed protein product [Rotaria sordida]|uniref:FYVE-type domain-containing protein n=1 Tax=Rotaria sordida TaxID=392033 RepID=A0A814DSK5_9BILA|nr:unnamed protein product [Rotaria sordida]
MAAAIDENAGKNRRPELLNKIDIEVNVNDAILLTTEDGLLTALEDRTLRIWIRRQTGKYWPSVCYTLESAPTTLFYHESSHRLFCGCDTGLLHEFLVSEDFNKITLQCTYLGHQNRIQALYFSLHTEILLSVCRDKKLNWYSTNPLDENHQHPRGNHILSSWAMSLAFDELSRQCFVGDSNGNIHFLRINTDNKFQIITTLSGHTGGVQTLSWDPELGWLFSGSFDTSIVVWDIGTHKGIALELNGHSDRLIEISYDKLRKILITCSADGSIGVWPMNVRRNETPKWLESDHCQICQLPFFWNIQAMWKQKQLGLRQHHCRRCGRAVCHGCSQTRTKLPSIGYETVQRICNDCGKTLKNEETVSLAAFYDLRQAIIKMDYNQTKKIMMTVGTDRTVKINQCLIKLRIHVYNSYSVSNIYPYFSQSFYILTSNNISQFVLPSLPSYVKYISSEPNKILIDEKNASIKIQSSSLFSSYSYDFYIKAIDSQIPSLSCSIPIRIYFGINQQSPRLFENLTKQSIEISSREFIYQIQAYDPDLSFNNQNNLFPPTIEYEIYDSLENVEIERYTGRIFFKNINQSIYNFTIILTDFGQPNRLITRQQITFDFISNEKLNQQEIPIIISTTFILISACILSIIILLIIIIILFNCYQGKLSTKKSLSNLSPTTPDSCLIDNEYITTTTSLPRVVNREQRIYPTISNDNQRKLLEQIHLPPPSLYSNEKLSIKQDYQRNLSMNDINKYLERFEKIYNNSSEHHLGEPVGSVV